jgi:hypothetical protein
MNTEVREMLERCGLLDVDIGTYNRIRALIMLAKERERERAAMICHACRDFEYASEEVARRILAN